MISSDVVFQPNIDDTEIDCKSHYQSIEDEFTLMLFMYQADKYVFQKRLELYKHVVGCGNLFQSI